MPVGPAFTFMIATPIVNPIVLLSTYNAFPTMTEMALYRAVFGIAGAILIGWLVDRAQGKSILRGNKAPACGHDHSEGHDAGHECCVAGHDHASGSPFRQVIAHTNAEIQSVGMYLIFGAIIAASMQILVPTDVLAEIGSGRVMSIAVMMILAFVLSLCSEADAFVASTFLQQFSGASVLAFLLTGPMIDIKNTLMLFGSFKKGFVVRLVITILLVCFALALLASFLIGGDYA